MQKQEEDKRKQDLEATNSDSVHNLLDAEHTCSVWMKWPWLEVGLTKTFNTWVHVVSSNVAFSVSYFKETAGIG